MRAIVRLREYGQTACDRVKSMFRLHAGFASESVYPELLGPDGIE
jgi:hypothetical protein